ncbi:MAG TPA: ATP-binding protein [Usitatibacter sp.]|nr:ATP-binding protein [Usitatibacter sp.]
MNDRTASPPPPARHCLDGGEHMGALMRGLDWSGTRLGPVESWSPMLQMTVRMILANRMPMLLWWRPDFSQLYNDAFIPALGLKHPGALAQPARDCWSEAWPALKPLIEKPFHGGEASWHDDLVLEIDRKGFLEETHWTVAFSPVPDDAEPGGIGGVIGALTEITARVLADRRIVMLRDIASGTFEARSAQEACEVAAATCGEHRADVPFALFYLLDPARTRATLAATCGVPAGSAAAPAEIELASPASSPWPLAEAMRGESLQEVEGLESRAGLGGLARTAVVCPIGAQVPGQTAGLLVAGVSPKLELDAAYRDFFMLLATQLGAIVSSARAHEAERRRATVAELAERHQAEQRLRSSERRFRMLAEAIPHHVWTYRSDGSMGYWNRRLVDYTGLSEQQLRDGGWDAVHPEDVERARAAWQSAVESGTDYEIEQRLRGRDGRYRRFICRGVVVKDVRGRPLEWFGTHTDVEDRLRTEESIEKLKGELAHVARVTTLGELAASIAHELNQPLAAIATNAHACMHWLAALPPNMREANDAVQRIVRDTNRAAQVIQRIRAFLKRSSMRAADLDIGSVVAEVVAIVRPQVRAHEVALSVSRTAALPRVAGDRIQLQQVLLNLVINALDAMAAVDDRPRTLHVELARHDGAFVRVSVRDNGVGIEPLDRERVFDAFHTTKKDGLGMGLAISRSLVEAQGGRLWATPNETHGETFHFTVPIAEE